MSEQSEQLVLDYVRRAGEAAYGTLRADQRLDFLWRLRARIEEMRASAGASEPEQVRKVLARFGDPAALVRREGDRLERERAEHHGNDAHASPDVAETVAGTSPEEAPVTEPIPVVRTRGEGGPRRPEGEQPDGDWPRPAEESGSTTGGRQGAQPDTEEGQGTAAADAAVGRAGHPGGPAERRRATGSTPEARPQHSGPPVYEPRSPRQAGQDAPSAASRLVDRLPPEVREAFRGGAIEGVGLVLLGLGGALMPLPLWFVGAVLVSLAARWSLQDKLLGLLPPGVLAVVGSAVFAATNYGELQSFVLQLRAYGWTFFRAGAVLGAVYLLSAVLVKRRNSRSKSPPWLRGTPDA